MLARTNEVCAGAVLLVLVPNTYPYVNLTVINVYFTYCFCALARANPMRSTAW